MGLVAPYLWLVVAMVAIATYFYLIWRRGRDLHFEEAALFDVTIVSIIWYLVGSRLGYYLTHGQEFGLRLGNYVNIWGKPGLWLPAGMVFMGGSLWWEARKRKWDLWLLTDVLAPATALTQGILALGNLINGTGYGGVTTWFFGVQFAGLYDKRVPVQGLEMVWFVGLFVLLWWLESAYRTFAWYKGNKSEAKSGFVTAIYLMGLGLGLWLMGLLRPAGWLVYGYKIEPWLMWFFFGLGVGLLYSRWGGSWQRTSKRWQENRQKRSGKFDTLTLGKNIFD